MAIWSAVWRAEKAAAYAGKPRHCQHPPETDPPVENPSRCRVSSIDPSQAHQSFIGPVPGGTGIDEAMALVEANGVVVGSLHR